MEGVFTAGDGDLSVVYQSAANIWGSWGATYTEGVEPEDFEDDRAIGFIGDVGDAGDELASRMWIRADVSMDQDSQTSTVPQVFRDARERTSGEVVVERTISGAGLGGLVPYVNFRHGDEIGTIVGSKVVPLPVNSVEYSTEVDGDVDYIVGVGKGLLGNARERDARTVALEAQIRAETAERDRRIAEEAKREAGKAVRPINTDLDKALDLYNGGKLGIGTDNRFTWITQQNQQADAVIDGKVDGVSGEVSSMQTTLGNVDRLVTSQIGANGTIRNNVNRMDNIVNGSSTPTKNGNLWNMNISNWDFQGKFNEAQTAINKWVADSIAALDNRIPVVLSLSKTSQSGVGRIYKSGDHYYFQKYFSANCRVLWVVALEAIDSYAYTTSVDMTGGYNQSYGIKPGFLQNITSVTVTIYRQDKMPEISLPTNIYRGSDPRNYWHT